MTAPGPSHFFQTQPRLSRFSIRGLLSLPRRLCSPPAAVGKVRSFGLTPIFDVRLEDVLDRKHLPPLSLKDFEEWLLYVEQSVENLYFILWLREYTAKYDRWIAKVRAREAKSKHGRGLQSTASHAPTTYRVAWSNTTPTSPALALFFSRARETFLVPGAPYELSLPPALLDALAVVSGHPDPAVLAPARAHVEDALRASLARCVRAAYSNVGAYRAACGIAAGIFILLVGTVPPLTVNFVRHQNRWERLVILPGLWLGLTVLLASLRGICMMIYIFGDFRQLRKFELVRPLPPVSTRSSFESSIRAPAAIAVPTRPVRALTAPPKIAIRIPNTRTPTLSYGTTTSVTTSTDASLGTQSSYTNTNLTSHTHTISISSLKSRGGTSSLIFPHGLTSSAGYPESETRSVPVYASDSEDSFDEDEDGEIGGDEADAMSTASEHGIYISPAMQSPDMAAEDDPAVVNAALALIASEAAGSTGKVSLGGAGSASGGAPGASAVPPVPLASASVNASAPLPARTQTMQTVQQIPTAPFIPTYPYSDADSIRAHKHRRSQSCSRSRSLSKPGDVSARDLEAGLASAAATAPAPVLKMGTFDFDALPIPPAPPVPVPPASVPASRPRAPEPYLDTNVSGMVDENEKGLILASPNSGYNLGLSTGTGTECDPVSPARTDDAAVLCEKSSSSSSAFESSSGESSSGMGRQGHGHGSSWRTHSHAHSHHSRFNLPFFFRLPRLFSLFHPRHHSPSLSSSSSHHSSSSSPSHAYNAFNDFSPYSAYTKAKAKCSGSGSGRGRMWRTRCALESRVPAFGPVTRVLAPVVARAQWEIVVRAACVGAMLGTLVAGVVVALPVPG